MSHQSYLRISDITKKLGISFEELRREFAECGIGITKHDMVTRKTLKYVLDGTFDTEVDRGKELHLETGDIVGDVQRKPMKGNEGSESDIRHHDLSVSGRAQRLGISDTIVLHELRSHGWRGKKNSLASYDDIRSVIASVELQDAWETHYGVSGTDIGDSMLPDQHGSYSISEMALYLGVPAPSLVAWLRASGKNTFVPPTSNASGSWAAQEEEDVPVGVVASGNHILTSTGEKVHAGIAWGLLGFLAIPLLFGLFRDTKTGMQDMYGSITGGAEIDYSLFPGRSHSVAGEYNEKEKRDDKDGKVRTFKDADSEFVIDTFKQTDSVLRSDTFKDSHKDMKTDPLVGADDLEEKDLPKSIISAFIEHLAGDEGGASHGAALPSELPETGVDY